MSNPLNTLEKEKLYKLNQNPITPNMKKFAKSPNNSVR